MVRKVDELSRQGTRETTQTTGIKPLNLRSSMMIMINMVRKRNYPNHRDKTYELEVNYDDDDKNCERSKLPQ